MFFELIANIFYENHKFLGKVRVICPAADAPCVDGVAAKTVFPHYQGKFFHYISALEIQDAFPVFSLDPRHELVERSHCPGYDVVEFSVNIFSPCIDSLHILEPEA